MTGPDPEPLGQLIDVALVERTLVDEGQRTLDGRPGPLPGRTEGRCFRTASETRPKAGMLCRGCAAIEPDIARQGSPRRTHRATVDAGGLDRHENHPVPRRIAASEGLILCGKVEHGNAIPSTASLGEVGCEDHVRKRPLTISRRPGSLDPFGRKSSLLDASPGQTFPEAASRDYSAGSIGAGIFATDISVLATWLSS